MELAVWILVAAVIWFGISVTQALKEVANETKAIRQYLQVNGELKHSSIPAHVLNLVEQIGEAVIQREKSNK